MKERIGFWERRSSSSCQCAMTSGGSSWRRHLLLYYVLGHGMAPEIIPIPGWIIHFGNRNLFLVPTDSSKKLGFRERGMLKVGRWRVVVDVGGSFLRLRRSAATCVAFPSHLNLTTTLFMDNFCRWCRCSSKSSTWISDLFN